VIYTNDNEEENETPLCYFVGHMDYDSKANNLAAGTIVCHLSPKVG
jgi:hypothetical protein